MKINWGTGITITIVVFMLISFGLIYFSFNQEVNLVRDDYYEAEVKHDEQTETINRTNNLTNPLKISVDASSVLIKFPDDAEDTKISGEIMFYRPSDRNLDFTVKIDPDTSNQQIVKTEKLLKGMWKVNVYWNIDSVKYYNEQIIMVQ